jgi:hypothetical protein
MEAHLKIIFFNDQLHNIIVSYQFSRNEKIRCQKLYLPTCISYIIDTRLIIFDTFLNDKREQFKLLKI